MLAGVPPARQYEFPQHEKDRQMINKKREREALVIEGEPVPCTIFRFLRPVLSNIRAIVLNSGGGPEIFIMLKIGNHGIVY